MLDPLQGRAWKGVTDAVPDEVKQGAQGERAQANTLQLIAERLLESERIGGLPELNPNRDQEGDLPAALEPPQCEAECRRRRSVEPLHVVDRHEEPRPRGEVLEHRHDGRTDDPRVG